MSEAEVAVNSPNASSEVLSPKKSGKRPVSTACHARKVKCSGGQPCDGCRQSRKESECSYPRRQRMVKVDQRYLERLVEENKQLRNQEPVSSVQQRPSSLAAEPSVAEPSMDEQPWFLSINIPHTPILVGEASDLGFATRFRQSLLSDTHGHIPRLNYPSDEQLLGLSEAECAWPPASKARMLLHVAFRHVSGHYHIVRKSQILRGLENVLQNPASASFFMKSKLWALFAIGELYSAHTVNKVYGYPGMLYFAKATKGLAVISERPHIDAIEIRLLLSFYSLGINRRHSAYVLAGSAVRLSVVMGLHLNVPESQLSDVLVREHRTRVWWTAYIFDRMWALNLGNPIAVPDEAVDVAMPSDPDPSLSESSDFADAAPYIARIHLAEISGRMVQSIYVRKTHTTQQEVMLSQRVQRILKDLHEWAENIPLALRLENTLEGSTLKSTSLSLYLSFNQSVIVATRPILLYIFRAYASSWKDSTAPEPQIPASAASLAEACSRCARESLNLLTERWVDGSFPTFDYFYPQYLFSAGTIVAVSSLLPRSKDKSEKDSEQFDSAIDVLMELRDSGHLAAAEFCQHFEAIKILTDNLSATRGDPDEPPSILKNLTAFNSPPTATALAINPVVTPGNTASLPGQSLQELLMPPSLDLEFIDSTLFQDISQGLYWPKISPENGGEEDWTSVTSPSH
ncbi:unnamed protein product [Clonostachys chloroleuca]|uniref:Xylanolytic transcriptional activator regulatory domain-containing protein n=1 Tax=Clonostachys chloroleuca TaxID=1926264 RepID=A0AA35PXF4_9HYPO|nr:unnamed protein product [Clonostachys chloroleuca]